MDRVRRELKGADANDTAMRQMAAFYQMRTMLYDLATRNRGDGTPDEERIANSYYAAASEVAKEAGLTRSRYDVDPRFRDELLAQFFTPAFRTNYFAKMGIIDARIQARAATDIQAQKDAIAAAAAAAPKSDPGTEEARRCVAAGRNPLDCIAGVMGSGLNEMLGMVNPSLKVAPLPPGLRMNGAYPGPNSFSLVFHPETVTVACGPIIPAPHTYTVELRGPQVAVTVENVPKPILLTVRPDGSLTGPGLTSIQGRVVAGTRSGTRHYTDGTTAPITETLYETRTVQCNVASLAAAGPSPREGPSALMAIPIFERPALELAGSQALKATPGLRMTGTYAAPTGFSIEFHDESAVLGCRQAQIARAYRVEFQGNQVLVRVEHQPAAVILNLTPGGTLSGAGTIRVDGREVAGFADNQGVVYTPRSDSCALGTLIPSTRRTP